MSRVGLFGQISEINDHLYLSGAGVFRPEKMKQKKISCVINATTEEPNAYLPGVDCVKIRIEDSPYARLDHYFDMVADKIRSVKERGGRTLVHCVAGVSRSASLCIVYLVKYERMSLRQAYHYVKSARPIIRPNIGFWKQMVEYEKKLRGHSTVSMVTVDSCPLPFPDVYSNDLKKHIMQHPGPAQHDPTIIAMQQQNSRSALSSSLNGKSTMIPIDFGSKRRGISVGTMDSLKSRNRHSALPLSSSSNGYHSPWRPASSISFLSPAANRRTTGGSNKHENLFGNFAVEHNCGACSSSLSLDYNSVDKFQFCYNIAKASSLYEFARLYDASNGNFSSLLLTMIRMAELIFKNYKQHVVDSLQPGTSI